MRLKNVRLAGFKSFADPSVIPFHEQISIIVGPNGCGKSNVIDAIRWVLGGTSKQLRGDTSEDVIFNGTNQRKPVGQASVELILDNNAGRLGGAYSQYAEISIRRQVNRDGQSAYYLNGTRCRRRDVLDILLGTGLGPNSYAIIEQGTISRLIEAKPDELRSYLEEAAGISKYKERRREAELRIQHTRDNLARLNDLRAEIERQLKHLHQQAETASKYQTWRQEERLLKAQLLTLRWQASTQQMQSIQQAINSHENDLASVTSELRTVEAKLEQLRLQQFEQQQAQQTVQSSYYQLGLEITELEQAQKHQLIQQQQWQAEQQEIENNLAKLNQQAQNDQQQIAALTEQLENLEPQLHQAQQQVDAAQHVLQTAEQQYSLWQNDWENFNQQAAHRSQQVELAEAKIRHLEQGLLTSQQRYTHLLSEQQRHTDMASAPDKIQWYEEQLSQLAVEQNQCQQQIAHLQQAITQQQQTHLTIIHNIEVNRESLQKLQGQATAIESLQQAALGQSDKPMLAWLKRFGLDQQERLGSCLQVEKGWEFAVEVVLADRLQAVCLSSLPDQLHELVEQLPAGTLNLFATYSQSVKADATPQADSLASKVAAPWHINEFFASVYIAENLSAALTKVSQLNIGESVITPEGIWLGRNWLRANKTQDAKVGILQRKQQLQVLNEKITAINQQLVQQAQILQSGKEELQKLEQQLVRLQGQKANLNQQQFDLQAQLKVEQAQQAQQQQRMLQFANDLQHYQQQIERLEAEKAQLENTWKTALAAITSDNTLREQLQRTRAEHQEQISQAKQNVTQFQQNIHQLELEQKTWQAQQQSLEQAHGRLYEQILHLQARLQVIQESQRHQQNVQPDLELKLEQKLQARIAMEEQLRTLQQAIQAIELPLVQHDQQVKEFNQRSIQLGEQLAAQRQEQQGVRVLRDTFSQQLSELQYTVENLLASLPKQVDFEKDYPSWEIQLERIHKRIERLGPVNLAAIDEYQTQLERKNYLDRQNNDLESALATLTDAIQKIDAETRSRFKETYTEVNNNFQRLFPRLFGGGQAALELTANDLLEAGVQVIARPPGKRNSTIHLLSGGEKALTAVALVFAIFQLNPAPFCILDEVDAPLDDANVGRFCALVEEMSKHVQFIFISHNKASMAIAHHLLGVTMQEPGISRLVSVDMDATLNSVPMSEEPVYA